MLEVLNMKCRSEFKLGFTNRGCLHCAILKALHEFKKNRAHKPKGMQFFLEKCLKWDFQDFENT